MPSFVASIEVYFDADTLAQAEAIADSLADAVGNSPEPVHINGLTSGVARTAFDDMRSY